MDVENVNSYMSDARRAQIRRLERSAVTRHAAIFFVWLFPYCFYTTEGRIWEASLVLGFTILGFYWSVEQVPRAAQYKDMRPYMIYGPYVGSMSTFSLMAIIAHMMIDHGDATLAISVVSIYALVNFYAYGYMLLYDERDDITPVFAVAYVFYRVMTEYPPKWWAVALWRVLFGNVYTSKAPSSKSEELSAMRWTIASIFARVTVGVLLSIGFYLYTMHNMATVVGGVNIGRPAAWGPFLCSLSHVWVLSGMPNDLSSYEGSSRKYLHSIGLALGMTFLFVDLHVYLLMFLFLSEEQGYHSTDVALGAIAGVFLCLEVFAALLLRILAPALRSPFGLSLILGILNFFNRAYSKCYPPGENNTASIIGSIRSFISTVMNGDPYDLPE